MKSIITYLCLTICSVAYQSAGQTDAAGLYERACIALEAKDYISAERDFEAAFNLDNSLAYAAYMIGYLNLYYLPEVNFQKSIKFLSVVEKSIPDDINKNYFYNHLGLANLYIAISDKEAGKSYEDKRRKSEDYFMRALSIEANDITYNNVGRALIESDNIEKVKSSVQYFDNAIKVNSKPAYVHNKATALERIGHYYSQLVKAESLNQGFVELSYDYFVQARDLYESNLSYPKSLKRAEAVKKYYLSRKVYDRLRLK